MNDPAVAPIDQLLDEFFPQRVGVDLVAAHHHQVVRRLRVHGRDLDPQPEGVAHQKLAAFSDKKPLHVL